MCLGGVFCNRVVDLSAHVLSESGPRSPVATKTPNRQDFLRGAHEAKDSKSQTIDRHHHCRCLQLLEQEQDIVVPAIAVVEKNITGTAIAAPSVMLAALDESTSALRATNTEVYGLYNEIVKV